MVDLALLSNLHFLRPWWFLLFIPFITISVVQWRSGDLGRQWKGVIAPHLLPHMLVSGNQRRLFSPLWIQAIAIPILIIALAGPSWSRGESPFAVDSASLVIAVDLSDSMSSNDLQPDRLQRGRSKILELSKARGDAYTGLVAYAGTGHMVLPLSNDSNMLLYYLDAMQVGMLPKRGKSPDMIIPQVTVMLGSEGGTLLIVTDGAPESSLEAFGHLRDKNSIQVIVWGMGKTQEALNIDADRGLKSDALPIDEESLIALAETSGGVYQRVSKDDEDVNLILQQIDRHYELSGDSSRPWLDGGYYFVGPVMLLFLLWFRKGWALRW
jgi:Ca-activated chloride channel family protein